MKKKDCSLEGKINFFHKKEKSDFVFLWTLKICNFSSNCIEKLSLKDALSNHFFFLASKFDKILGNKTYHSPKSLMVVHLTTQTGYRHGYI